ncbi:hypothetical protein DFH27DRAFT_319642 [Peziza echinospora]|nr:hypothetical protein DFH27DRAFT_319642 [Peziza echinospora]
MSSEPKPQFNLPEIPLAAERFLDHVEQNPGASVHKLLEPFNAWEAVLRSVFAQDPNNEIVENNVVNLVDVFSNGNSDKVRIRGRNLEAETVQEQERYIMPLTAEKRKKDGEPGIVPTLGDFQKNFNVFTESAFANFNWNNIIVAGSAVTTCLSPVPEKYAGTLKGKREYYHEIVAPASDIDLFIYGIDDEKAAIDRMIAIENDITGSMLGETTCLRTKNCITIVSQYPNRHIQIVLRLYKSISQILTGFDVNCSCVAYNGSTVYANPRALTAFMTQCNTMDLSRRSPSYESRLAKYNHRGFEVYCDFLDRSKIDPTIFERSFSRTVGLARLLVLERLPSPCDREAYVDKRRAERGLRRQNNQYYSPSNMKNKDLKANGAEEIPEWQVEDDVSSYNTFTIPYGRTFTARKIERIFFTKDMLLNAEWNDNNRPPARPYALHRHPAFIGSVAEIIEDCCGFCPSPETDEEKEFYKEECKRYIHGPITFMKDDPGRQEIGSFNPLNANDYTDMAYIADQESLFRAIVQGDVSAVQAWCNREGVDINRRDHCGRTPLHVATMSSDSLEILQTLIDRGARLIARLQDGRTALHIAAGRGKPDFIEALLRKSEHNEQEKFEKEDRKRMSKKSQHTESNVDDITTENEEDASGSVNSEDSANYAQSDSDDEKTSTAHSFVKLKKKAEDAQDIIPEESSEDPDILDVNLPDWDFKMSPLHHAILADSGDGEKAVEVLVSSFGADILQPLKLQDDSGVILNITLPFLVYPQPASISVLRTLLKCGASCVQANSYNLATGLHSIVALPRLLKETAWDKNIFAPSDALKVVFELDGPAARGVVNFFAVGDINQLQYIYSSGCIETPLQTAIFFKDIQSAKLLLENNASPTLTLDSFVRLLGAKGNIKYSSEDLKKYHEKSTIQPLELAIMAEAPLVKELLAAGADPSTITAETYSTLQNLHSYNPDYRTVLDLVQDKIKQYQAMLETEIPLDKNNDLTDPSVELLSPYQEGTYQRFSVEIQIIRKSAQLEQIRKSKGEYAFTPASEVQRRKNVAIREALGILQEAEKELLEKGAKSYTELVPGSVRNPRNDQSSNRNTPEPTEWVPLTGINAPNIGDSTRDAYSELFEAAWKGDIAEIKRLCEFDDNDSLPKGQILVAVNDKIAISPFNIAVMNGHLEAAKLILTIAAAQYSAPQSNVTSRYTVSTFGKSEPQVLQETLNTAFVIDNIADEAAQAPKSSISPLEMMKQKSPVLVEDNDTPMFIKELNWDSLTWAVYRSDTVTIENLLQWADEQQVDGAYSLIGPTPPSTSGIMHDPFVLAMRKGQIEVLKLFMQKVGLGLDYQTLQEREFDTGLVKPPYYPGLTIGGKRKKDWAKSANPQWQKAVGKVENLLPMAAALGNFTTFRWLLSDGPLQCVQQFIKDHPDNARAKLLARLSDLPQAIKEAINPECGLIAHLIARYWNGSQSEQLLDYWLGIHPSHLEAKCARGMTPLLVAVKMGKHDAIKYFLSKGANTLAKNLQSETMLDLSFAAGLERAQFVVPLIPKDDLKRLLTHRSYIYNIASTVFRRLFYESGSISVPLFEYLISISEGHGLDVFNGDGTLPIHTAVACGYVECTKLILKTRPEMLYRENANGRTPLDICRDHSLHELHRRGMSIIPRYSQHAYQLGVLQSTGYTAISSTTQVKEYRETPQHPQVYELLREAVKTTKLPRIRASLIEANELANRIVYANKNKWTRVEPETDIVESYRLELRDSI